MMKRFKKFLGYEKFYTKKHEKTIRKYGNLIKLLVEEQLRQEFANSESTIWLNCQMGVDNIKPVLITVFVKDVYSIKPCNCVDPYDANNCMSCNMKYRFEYKNRIEKVVNAEFGKFTGERFVLVNIFTKD